METDQQCFSSFSSSMSSPFSTASSYSSHTVDFFLPFPFPIAPPAEDDAAEVPVFFFLWLLAGCLGPEVDAAFDVSAPVVLAFLDATGFFFFGAALGARFDCVCGGVWLSSSIGSLSSLSRTGLAVFFVRPVAGAERGVAFLVRPRSMTFGLSSVEKELIGSSSSSAACSRSDDRRAMSCVVLAVRPSVAEQVGDTAAQHVSRRASSALLGRDNRYPLTGFYFVMGGHERLKPSLSLRLGRPGRIRHVAALVVRSRSNTPIVKFGLIGIQLGEALGQLGRRVHGTGAVELLGRRELLRVRLVRRLSNTVRAEHFA